jgi:serine/threonine protein kinase
MQGVDHINQNEDSSPIESGASAKVYHGLCDGNDVAIKDFRLRLDKFVKLKKVRTFRVSGTSAWFLSRIPQKFVKEAAILSLLQHRNLVPFIGVIYKPSRFCIITMWMDNGDVLKYVNTHPDTSRISLVRRSSSATPTMHFDTFSMAVHDIVNGMHYLKQCKIVHGDLKGVINNHHVLYSASFYSCTDLFVQANILVDGQGTARISDFGVSFISNLTQQRLSHSASHPPVPSVDGARSCESTRQILSTASGGGTWRYMAPERLLPDLYGCESGRATFSSDIFSLALVIYEV